MEYVRLLNQKHGKKKGGKYYDITIEPMTLIYYAAIGLTSNLESNLLLTKTADGAEDAIPEQVVANLNTWTLLLNSILDTLVAVYLCPLTDKYPICRSILLYIPVIGQIFLNIFDCIASIRPDVGIEATAITQAILSGITGSSITTSLLSISYLARITDKKERTVRIGYYYCASSLGQAIGEGFSGYMYVWIGLWHSFMLCALLNVIALGFGVFYINELLEEDSDELITKKKEISIIKVALKPRSGYKQLIILCAAITYPLLKVRNTGETSILYLYLRYRFGWDAISYGVLRFFKDMVYFTGTLFCSEILTKYFGFSDPIIGILATTADALASYCMFIMVKSWEIYAISLFALMYANINFISLSLATQCVENHEYGQLNALFGLLDGLAPIAYPVYNFVFSQTLQALPNAIFLISLSAVTPTIIIYIIIYVLWKHTDFSDVS